MRRRVVITGLGLICGVGNTTPEVWGQLLAGTSGVGPIQSFDTTGFPVTFADEVKNFDPLAFIDKKESRKMGRFIHLAVAATHEAMQQSGLKITPDIEERVGVFIGSGIGGFEIIEREHRNLTEGGPRKISPFFIPAAIVNMAAGQRPKVVGKHDLDGQLLGAPHFADNPCLNLGKSPLQNWQGLLFEASGRDVAADLARLGPTKHFEFLNTTQQTNPRCKSYFSERIRMIEP